MNSEKQILRLLVHNLSCYSTHTQIQLLLRQHGFQVIFANIKVASWNIFWQQKHNYETCGSYLEVKIIPRCSLALDKFSTWNALDSYRTSVTHKGFNFPISCYVEIFGDENTKEQLNSTSFDIFQQPVQIEWLEKQSSLNFTTTTLFWYPDIFSQIIKFFHAPPSQMEKIYKNNSYNIWFAMFSIRLRGCCIVHSGPFRNNKIIIELATNCILDYIEKSSDAYDDVAPILEKCKDITLAVVKKYKYAYNHLGNIMKQDRDVVLATIANNGELIERIPQHFKQERSIVELALNQCPDALSKTLPQFRDDKELVLLAVSKNPYLFSAASDRLKNDDQVFAVAKFKLIEMSRTREFFTLFRGTRAHELLLRDKEIVLAAVTFNGHELQYVNEDFKADEDILQAALLQNENAIQYVLNQVLKYPHIVEAAKQRMLLKMQNNGNLLAAAAEFFKEDKDITIAAVQNIGVALCFALPTFRNDFDVVMAAVKQNGYALQFASQNLKENREIVLAAVTTNGNALQFTNTLNGDEEIVKIAVHQNGYALQFASNACKKNMDILVIAVKENIHVLELITNGKLRKKVSELCETQH